MPVVRKSGIRCYTRPNGQRRFIKLFGAYCNMLARIRGQVRTGRSGLPIWAGLPTDFTDFDDFRAWALAKGYSKTNCSLDRKKSHLGYERSNLRWVTPLQNSTYANLIGAAKRRQLQAKQPRAFNAGVRF